MEETTHSSSCLTPSLTTSHGQEPQSQILTHTGPEDYSEE